MAETVSWESSKTVFLGDNNPVMIRQKISIMEPHARVDHSRSRSPSRGTRSRSTLIDAEFKAVFSRDTVPTEVRQQLTIETGTDRSRSRSLSQGTRLRDPFEGSVVEPAPEPRIDVSEAQSLLNVAADHTEELRALLGEMAAVAGQLASVLRPGQ